jgi:hypothetical protein
MERVVTEARFRPGDRVEVLDLPRPGHVRTPGYVRGRVGEVLRAHGSFPNPEELAYGRDGLPARWLYLVAFRSCDLWPDDPIPTRDELLADVYEHWLAPPTDQETQ